MPNKINVRNYSAIHKSRSVFSCSCIINEGVSSLIVIQDRQIVCGFVEITELLQKGEVSTIAAISPDEDPAR